ncbi:MAG: hypothetical protein JOY80_12315 [Candidatus Dormibacteraeota bacterium]|nr:hypothetical protein [Candidatus Dormibacteraeota bacterium]
MVNLMKAEGGKHESLAAFAADYDSRVLQAAQREGSLQCSEHGCTKSTAVSCEYADRRGRQCGTAWCPEHRALVEDHVYCRRHAGVVSSLPGADSSLVVPRPDIDNRAPSLVGWVARLIDGDVWRLLLSELDAQTGGQLIADPVMLVFTGLERQRAWERSWKVMTHTGITRRVSILVEEADDAEVEIKVGLNIVDRVTPPWITHRRHGDHVDEEQDTREREEFNRRVLKAIEDAVMAERHSGAEEAGTA